MCGRLGRFVKSGKVIRFTLREKKEGKGRDQGAIQQHKDNRMPPEVKFEVFDERQRKREAEHQANIEKAFQDRIKRKTA